MDIKNKLNVLLKHIFDYLIPIEKRTKKQLIQDGWVISQAQSSCSSKKEDISIK